MKQFRFKPTREVFSPSPREGLPFDPHQELRYYDQLNMTTEFIAYVFFEKISLHKN